MRRVEVDFVVAGAGLAGMIAAVAAARRGMKVALINDRSVLGGNASSEIGVRIQGASHHGLNVAVYAKESGLVEELRQQMNFAISHQGYTLLSAPDKVFFDFIYREKNIELYLNTVITDVCVKAGRIESLLAYQMKADVSYEFCAPLFADCTGDGVVAFKAGASYHMGSEPRWQYGEKWAPEQEEPYTMGNTIFYEIEDVGQPVPFVRPDFAYDVSKMDFMQDIENPLKFRQLYVGGNFWTLEYGGQVNTICDNEQIQLELRKLAFGLWDYIKNSGKFPQAANFKMKRMYALAGTRESRRILGDYVLTENDIEEKRQFEDSVAMGGWPMDVHAPKGIYDDLPASNFISVSGMYSIPYRCLYAKDIENLFLAGRDASASHIAMGSMRVMGTCGAMGQAVGTAAALCWKYRVVPREIYPKHVKRLQEELSFDDQTILGYRENSVLHFWASASSERTYENQLQDGALALTRNYGLALPVETKRLERVKVKLRNRSKEEQMITVRVMTGIHPETYLPQTLVKTITLCLTPEFYGWHEIFTDCDVGEDQKVYLGFVKNPQVELMVGSERTPGAVTFVYHDADGGSGYNHDTCPLDEQTGFIGQDILQEKNICFKDMVPTQKMFSVENTQNGYHRPYGLMHQWVSEKGAGQWLKLSAKTAQYVESLRLIFDNGLDVDGKDIISPKMVRDYDVRLDDGFVISIRDNIQRQNRIFLRRTVKEAVIEFLRTWGEESIALYAAEMEPPRSTEE